MPENQSPGTSAVADAVNAGTSQTSPSRARGGGGKFVGAKPTPVAQDVALGRHDEQLPDGSPHKREPGKEPLERKDREAFDLVRGHTQAAKNGKVQEKAAAPAEAADGNEEQSEAEASEPQGGKKRANEVDIAMARTALIRSGFRPKEVDSWPVNELVQRGQARARELEKADRAFDLVRELKTKKSRDADDGGKEAEQAAPLPTVDPEAITSLAKTLGLEGSEAKSLTDALTSLVKPLVDRIQEQQSQLNGVVGNSQQQIIESARQQLVGEFPELDDAERFGEVTETMAALVVLPKYQRMPVNLRAAALMRDAAVASGLEHDTSAEDERKSESEREARKERRQNGRSTSELRAVPSSATTLQRERALFDALRGGSDAPTARRLAGLV